MQYNIYNNIITIIILSHPSDILISITNPSSIIPIDKTTLDPI
jgi:hypothetical protein